MRRLGYSHRLPGCLVDLVSGGFLEGRVGRIVTSSSSTSDPATVGPSLMVGLPYTLGGSIVCDES